MKLNRLPFWALTVMIPFAIALFTAGSFPTKADNFVPSEAEKQALEALKSTPIRLAYSYEVVYTKLPDGSHAGMLAPFVDLLEKKIRSLKVEMRKLDWETAFKQVQSGEVDFYGPIGLTEQRRKDYLAIDPIFRADAEIVTRVVNPLGSARRSYEQKDRPFERLDHATAAFRLSPTRRGDRLLLDDGCDDARFGKRRNLLLCDGRQRRTGDHVA